MTEQTASKVPQIRFKGFEGDWEDKSIGEVLSEKKRPIVLKDHQRYELITVKRRNEGVVSRGHLFGRDILVKNYYQLQTGDFVISKRQVVHGATGMIPPKLDGAIVSNEYLVAVNSSKLLTEFLTILSSLPAMRQKFFLSSYGVDIEKLFFDAEDWKKRNVTIPDVTEQTQIGEYFRELDSLIGLHQREHDKLVTLKKAMLQKMFPQPGATIPEIRFKGFSGDWVESKLSELCDLFTDGDWIESKDQSASGIRLLQTGNVGVNEFIDKADKARWISLDTFERLNCEEVFAGDILISRLPEPAGRACIVPKLSHRVITAVDCTIVRTTKNCDPLFLVQHCALDSYFQTVKNYLGGGTRQRISRSALGNFFIQVPKFEEQQKIGTYFRTLDALMSKHATQLQKLQQIKSACLEKMFV